MEPGRPVRVLITRGEPAAGRTARTVEALGLHPVVAPLFRRRRIAFDRNLVDRADMLAFTSQTAVQALEQAGAVDPRTPVYAVGDRTAEAARHAGYLQVESAGGTVDQLAALIGDDNSRQPAGAAADKLIVHVSGREIAGDLVGALTSRGLTACRLIVYEMAADERLPETVGTAIARQEIDAALVYSPRAAEILSRALNDRFDAGHPGLLRLRFFALSHAVADRLRVPGAAISVAAAPYEDSLLDCLLRSCR